MHVRKKFSSTQLLNCCCIGCCNLTSLWGISAMWNCTGISIFSDWHLGNVQCTVIFTHDSCLFKRKCFHTTGGGCKLLYPCEPLNPFCTALIIFLVHKAQRVHPSTGAEIISDSPWQLQHSVNLPVKAYVWYSWLQREFFQGFCLEASFHQTITKMKKKPSSWQE